MGNRFRRQDPVRYSDVFTSMRTRERRHLRHRWQWIALGVVVVLAAIAGSGVYFYSLVAGGIQEDIEPVEPVEREGDPFTALVVGSDSRAGLTEQEQLELGASADGIAGERADTLMLARVDPATNRVTVVQFPRDLWVRVPGEGHNRINSALLGGKGKLVETVELLTGLEINHYVQLNIAGFRDLVDAIGGVEVCIPEPIRFDAKTGLEVRRPGMIHFDGNRALRFVRSRQVFAEGDLARIQNQQRFLAAAIDKVTSLETLIHPGRIRAVFRAVGDNLSVDRNTGPLDLYRLAQRFRSFDPRRYEAYMAPNLGPATVNGASVILPDLRAMRVMFSALEAGESPARADGVPNVDPAAINVGVYNGSFEEGAAADAARRLERAAGLSVDDSDIANAGRYGYRRTVVRHAPGDPEASKMARYVAAALPGAALRPGNTPPGIDVGVIVGKRTRVRPVVHILPIPIPKPGALPKVCRDEGSAPEAVGAAGGSGALR